MQILLIPSLDSNLQKDWRLRPFDRIMNPKRVVQSPKAFNLLRFSLDELCEQIQLHESGLLIRPNKEPSAPIGAGKCNSPPL